MTTHQRPPEQTTFTEWMLMQEGCSPHHIDTRKGVCIKCGLPATLPREEYEALIARQVREWAFFKRCMGE